MKGVKCRQKKNEPEESKTEKETSTRKIYEELEKRVTAEGESYIIRELI